MKATLNDLLNAKGVSEPLREAVKALINRLEAAEKERDALRGKAEAVEKNLRCCQAEREEAAALFLSVKTKLLAERDALRAAVRHEADCVEACKSEIDRLRAENAGLVDDMNLLRDNNTALRARIEAMERQRPVRLVFRSDELDEQIRRATDPAWAEKIEVPGGMVALYALPGAQAQPAPSMPEVTDAMALAFHRALTDGSIGAREVEEIKDALRAALAATPGSSRDDQHAGGLKVLNHQGLMERARQNAKKEAGLIYPDDDARREEKEQELASEYYRQYTTPNP